jgi:hypothetical protein
MILPPEYSWLESYLDNDNLWLDETLNWEEAFDLALSDLTVFAFFTTPYFFNSNFFIDSITKLSFLDIMLIHESNKIYNSKELYDFFIWDLTSIIYNKFLPLQFIFYTDYQDYVNTLLYYSPELMLALNDYITLYWSNNVLNYSPAVVFDLFSDVLNSSISEFLEDFILFFIFMWFALLFVNIFQIIKWNNPTEIYFVRLYYYIYSASKEMRIQFETMLLVFFFFFFYWTMMVATFDDDQEELIEMFDVSIFYFFCLLIAYLFFKYSQHYFAFLEASVTEGRTVSFISKQFFRDFINTFALFLRFFILLFRLNVYDTLDDFYDSYYIFLGDFDEDEYFSELFFSTNSLLFYDFDVNDDRIYSLEEEHDFFFDLFYLYFLAWGKLFTFIFFILEEILRLSLAFYICYLIVFEVHSVNCSYVEDNYFSLNRENNNKNLNSPLTQFRF